MSTPCHFFQRGFCRNGTSCRFSHSVTGSGYDGYSNTPVSNDRFSSPHISPFRRNVQHDNAMGASANRFAVLASPQATGWLCSSAAKPTSVFGYQSAAATNPFSAKPSPTPAISFGSPQSPATGSAFSGKTSNPFAESSHRVTRNPFAQTSSHPQSVSHASALGSKPSFAAPQAGSNPFSQVSSSPQSAFHTHSANFSSPNSSFSSSDVKSFIPQRGNFQSQYPNPLSPNSEMVKTPQESLQKMMDELQDVVHSLRWRATSVSCMLPGHSGRHHLPGTTDISPEEFRLAHQSGVSGDQQSPFSRSSAAVVALASPTPGLAAALTSYFANPNTSTAASLEQILMARVEQCLSGSAANTHITTHSAPIPSSHQTHSHSSAQDSRLTDSIPTVSGGATKSLFGKISVGGATGVQQSTHHNTFSLESDLSPEELAAFRADTFDLWKLPIKPPPINLCH